MERERTNSMTKLTKVIALEVNKPRFERLEEQVSQLEEKIDYTIYNMDGKGLVQAVHSSLKNAGDMWNQMEDALLVDEIAMAIATIAKNHGRSNGAIRARINHKDLI